MRSQIEPFMTCICALALFSCGSPEGESGSPSEAASAPLTMTVPVDRDTWVLEKTTTTTEFGQSCQLRVNSDAATWGGGKETSLLLSDLSLSKVCPTLKKAWLILRTGQLPAAAPGLTVRARRVLWNWLDGAAGLGACGSCSLGTSPGTPYTLPALAPPTSSIWVDSPCTSYQLDITTIVKDWCGGAGNYGIALYGYSPVRTRVDFHSIESPLPPEMIIEF